MIMGNVVGLKMLKEDLDRLSSKINDCIEPSVNFFDFKQN